MSGEFSPSDLTFCEWFSFSDEIANNSQLELLRKMAQSRRIFLKSVGAGVVAASLMPRAGLAAASKLQVVATTGMIADTARAIGGDLIDVQTLMGPGVDPHAYRQTRTDILAMRRADIILWNGLYLEAQMQEVLGELGARMPVVAVAETLNASHLVAHDDYDCLLYTSDAADD